MARPPGEQVVLAIDIGGTKMAAGLVDGNGELLQHSQIPTPPGAGADALFVSLGEMIAEVRALGQDRGVVGPMVCGVGCGGPMTWHGESVSPVNIPGWRGFPLRRRLAELVDLPTYVDNDAKALAVGEGWRGAAAGERNFLGMVVSTGVGGGIVLDGRLLDGRQGNAGHIGHVTVEPDGHACKCGAYGCLEAEASGTAIAKLTGKPARHAGADVIERTGTMVGRAVATVANLLDLQLAVVAGSVALGFGAPFFVAAQREIDHRAKLDFSLGTTICPAGLMGGGQLVGAAAVGFRGLGYDVFG
ncbi:MAG: ROK family protein [Actinobacteria bacterium]|nr:ROK family protein [Actinomycetota bacterium]